MIFKNLEETDIFLRGGALSERKYTDQDQKYYKKI